MKQIGKPGCIGICGSHTLHQSGGSQVHLTPIEVKGTHHLTVISMKLYSGLLHTFHFSYKKVIFCVGEKRAHSILFEVQCEDSLCHLYSDGAVVVCVHCPVSALRAKRGQVPHFR